MISSLLSNCGCNSWKLPNDYVDKSLKEKIVIYKEACRNNKLRRYGNTLSSGIRIHGLDALDKMIEIIYAQYDCFPKNEAATIIGLILIEDKTADKIYFLKSLKCLYWLRDKGEYPYERNAASMVIRWLEDEVKKRGFD